MAKRSTVMNGVGRIKSPYPLPGEEFTVREPVTVLTSPSFAGKPRTILSAG